MSAVQVFRKHCGRRRNCTSWAISPFTTEFLHLWTTFMHLHEYKNCHLQTLPAWKTPKFIIYETGLKGENAGNQHFLLLLQCFYLTKDRFHVWVTFNFPPANIFNLDKSKILLFGKVSTLFPSKPWFLHICSTSLLKTLWEKEKLLL